MAVSVSTGVTKGRMNDIWGARRVTKLAVTFDSDYAEGGEPFDPDLYHQGTVDSVICSPRANARGAVVTFDQANEKLQVFGKADGTRTFDELCHCDLSALVVDVFIISE